MANLEQNPRVSLYYSRGRHKKKTRWPACIIRVMPRTKLAVQST